MIRRKYGNKPQQMDGLKFASIRELKYYCDYKLLERAGQIRQLEIHPSFKLIVNGVKVGRFTADFAYFDDKGRHVIDVKSPSTAAGEAFRLRKRVFEACYPGIVLEIVK